MINRGLVFHSLSLVVPLRAPTFLKIGGATRIFYIVQSIPQVVLAMNERYQALYVPIRTINAIANILSISLREHVHKNEIQRN